MNKLALNALHEGITSIPIGLAPTNFEFITDQAQSTILTVAPHVETAKRYATRHRNPIAAVAITLATSLGVGSVGDKIEPAYDSATTFVGTAYNTATSFSADVLAKKAGSKIAYTSAGAVGAAGAFVIANNMGLNLDFPGINMPDGNFTPTPPQPGKVTAGIDEHAYEVEATMKVNCNTLVTVVVGVEGKKDNGTWQDEGTIDKRIYGDTLLCGDLEELESDITIHRNNVTGDVTEITGEMPEIEPTHARVDHLDPRNCIDADSNTTKEEADRLIEERRTAIANGETPKCDNGFDVPNVWYRPWEGPAHPDTAQLINLADAGAQLAMAVSIDTNLIPTIEQRQTDLEQDVYTYLRGKYGVTNDQIHLMDSDLSFGEILNNRLADIKEDLNERFIQYGFLQNEDGENVLKVTGPGGEEVMVKLFDDLTVEDLDAAVEVVEE